MSWYIYIIQSEIDGDYYKGISENVEKRLSEHNSGLSNFTSTKIPWKLVYVSAVETKRVAIIEEKRVKRLNRISLERLINSDNNLIK